MGFIFKKNGEKSLQELGGASPVLVFAIAWDNKAKGGILGKIVGIEHETDLDLSCAMYDGNGDRVDCVWYAQLRSKCGSIRHKGDDTVGTDVGDDELIIIDLGQLEDEVKTLFFVISSFSGENTLSTVEKAFWHVRDAQTRREIARYNFSGHDTASAKIVMRLQKTMDKGLPTWRIKALDEPATGKNIQEVFPEIRALIEG